MKRRFIPPRHIELSPWRTPLGIGRNNEKEVELEAYYDEDDIAQLKKEKQRRRE